MTAVVLPADDGDLTARTDDAIADAGQPGAGTEDFSRAAADVVTAADW